MFLNERSLDFASEDEIFDITKTKLEAVQRKRLIELGYKITPGWGRPLVTREQIRERTGLKDSKQKLRKEPNFDALDKELGLV